jgi:hypothetical protein
MLERSFRVSCSSRPRNPIARRSARGKARVHPHTATLKSVSGMRWQCPRHRFRRSTCAVVAAEDRSGHHNDASKHGQAQAARARESIAASRRPSASRPAGSRRAAKGLDQHQQRWSARRASEAFIPQRQPWDWRTTWRFGSAVGRRSSLHRDFAGAG